MNSHKVRSLYQIYNYITTWAIIAPELNTPVTLKKTQKFGFRFSGTKIAFVVCYFTIKYILIFLEFYGRLCILAISA